MDSIKKNKKINLPNLIIIGAAKCGTTSLHYYLGLHPQISMAREKELDFFIREMNWNKGIDWYKSNFTDHKEIHGEASPNYTNYPFFAGVPARMHSIVPEAKLIYLIRDPIARIISNYLHNYTEGKDDRRIEEALSRLDENPLVLQSKYFMQLEQYLEYFPKSNILIVTLDDLNHYRQETLQKIFKFIDIDESFFSTKFLTMQNISMGKRRKNRIGLFLKLFYESTVGRLLPLNIRRKIGQIFSIPFSTKIDRPRVDNRLQEELIEYLREDTNQLREYTGLDFDTWSL